MNTPESYDYPSWEPLKKHANDWSTSLANLFNQDPERSNRYTLSVGGLYLDYSKNHIDDKALTLLNSVAQEAGLPEAIKALFRGDIVNNTEHRPALHTALRSPKLSPSDKKDCVNKAQEQVATVVEKVHNGRWKGFNGKRITHVVNIGIGGSDLGPRMVVNALKDYQVDSIEVLFVANIDGSDLCDQIEHLNPESTLFIVASKSFSTLETKENALAARQWLLTNGCPVEQLHCHFIAVSSNIEAAVEFGIAEDHILPMWDWVGGRYSLWSAIGIPIAMALGVDNFKALLAGAEVMDEHFHSADLADNMPATLALLAFWYSSNWGYESQAILPYVQRLHRLPAYLQQLDMESLGKRVDRNGNDLTDNSGLILWGTEGTNGQHSFHQLLHQGTRKVLVDFIASIKPTSELETHHHYLMANCIGQSQALLEGKSLAQAKKELLEAGYDQKATDDIAPHKVIPGNRPSNTILMNELSPHSLGSLIALYEHKVYCLGVLWNLNPFDQWGVELGKQLGLKIYPAITSGDCDSGWDSSTKNLIRKLTS
ncbi:glucose-6-phosphate isomerase [Sessilibacter corallicola]|uniref:glucose-6-phosphate isomerase n=1 Tax=Sessilibacter corallicola TaxID=2904075 RepID=UPI001E29D753|nr:glucose-6-phosphate isomerase [Sessilibacter corallicola]MCE2027333.1 glucose-6-phosphate isomerase [Sessilibacter corallicola]